MILNFRPRLFIAGASAYSREIDFKRIRQIINRLNEEILNDVKENYEVYQDTISENGIDYIRNKYNKEKCYFMVDMAHIAGLVAAELHQSPIPYADVVTSTTHKTLRGPRGGIILTNDAEIAKKIDKAVFPGCQGGPLENIIAAKAVCFGEALKPEFKKYQEQVIKNAKVLANMLLNRDINLVTGGTDNHLILIDLRKEKISGLELEQRLANIGIITNKNAIPFDTKNKATTSGLRIGTPAITTRGLKEDEMILIGDLIADIIQDVITEKNAREIVDKIIKEYPLKNVLER